MTDAKQRWDAVGEQFTELGKNFKARYKTNATFDDAQRRQLDDALRNVGEALDAGFTTIGDSLRDPEMRDDVKRAGIAVADALAATFTDVAEEIRRAVQR
jgi:hypothetical protein